MAIKVVLFALLILEIASTHVSANVVINEVELDPSGDDASQWIELYNTEDVDVDISSWSIVPLSDRTKEEFIDITNISAKGFYVITFEEEWMDPSEETLILKDDEGNVVDRSAVLYDYSDSDCAWGRSPDGSSIWRFLISTQGEPTLGELCEEEESSQMHFNMDQSVGGSGYISIRNVMHNSDKEYLKTRESGSGIYSSEEASKYHADLKGSAYAMDLSKSNLSVRYSNSTFAVNPKRSINYISKWTESSSAHGDQESPSMCESHMDVTRLDSDILLHYRNYDLGARIASEYDGVGRINSRLSNYRASEEYTGSFEIKNDYSENISDEIRSSVEGEGFISTDKRIGGEGKTDQYAYTYEKGTGAYYCEEFIDASNISSLNISPIDIALPSESNIFHAKEVRLRHAPVNRSYARVTLAPMSISWKEGIGSGIKNGAFMNSEFSDLKELEAETLVISANDTRTSAKFTGRARLQAGYINSSNPAQESVFIEDEYVGNFSIIRGYRVYPAMNKPHMSISSQGQVDQQDCSIIRYIISLVNDGNRLLGPVFVRTSFPSGTSYLDSSIRPFELSSRYANWSISRLSIGESVNINLDLKVTTRRENYSSSSRAVTVYQVIRTYEKEDKETGNVTVLQTSSDRKLSASNISEFDADWSACDLRNLSVAFSATPNSKQPKILAYRLTLENQGQDNMSANITVILPSGVSFINSTSRQENISRNTYGWSINRLDAGKRRSISFMAQAEEDGFYVANASAIAHSLDDGMEIASTSVSAPVMVGKTVYSITPTFWQDWCPCDENLLEKGLSWNETSIKSGKDLGCLC